MTADTRSNMLKSVAVSNTELASNNNNDNIIKIIIIIIGPDSDTKTRAKQA